MKKNELLEKVSLASGLTKKEMLLPLIIINKKLP